MSSNQGKGKVGLLQVRCSVRPRNPNFLDKIRYIFRLCYITRHDSETLNLPDAPHRGGLKKASFLKS